MRFKTFKKKIINMLLFSALGYSMQAVGAVSIEDDTCFQENAQFISRYFSVEGFEPQELDNFFDCIDNLIKLFLNHTPYHRKIGYYTQTELRRAVQYMVRGVSPAQAEEMSKAMLKLKTGFIGGDPGKITTKEIAVCRKILYVFRRRMRSAAPAVFTMVRTINGQSPPGANLSVATDMLTTNLISMGSLLSKISFSSDLSVLEHLPQSLSVLGIHSGYLSYWKASLLLLRKWKSIFFTSPEHIIQSAEWPVLLNTFSQIMRLWFYYQKFLKNRPFLRADTVQHTQYFVSYSLNMVSERLGQSGKKDIALKDIDELVRRIWFLPYMSEPFFRLALRSVFCFLLNPITHSKPCRHSMDFQSENLKISFPDITFTVTDSGDLYESLSGGVGSRIKPGHLRVLTEYVNSWVISENHIRKAGGLLPLFGSPHKWLSRKIDVTDDGRLLFYAERSKSAALLSHLNWQSHLMKLVTSAYTKRENKPVQQKLWNTMIKEWTALGGSFYKDMKWRRFQKMGFQVFRHGDFLTSHSNGDAVLQEEEILEVFSFFMSSLKVTLAGLEDRPGCMRSTYRLQSSCVWDYLRSLSPAVFAGWPQFFKSLNDGKKTSYISRLSSFYEEAEEISIKDMFEIFLFIHYQENIMLRLDKDFSQHLSLREIEPLLNVFERTLIKDTPFIHTKASAFAFITYLFYYEQVPIFGQDNSISSPLHFSNWLLQPEKWQRVKVDREKILHSLFLINNLNN